MRPPTADEMIDRKTQALTGAARAAWLLRHRGMCPVCEGMRATVTREDPVTGRRIFRCLDCQWAANVSEPQYRGAANSTLRVICEAALAMREARQKSRRAGSRTRSKRRSKEQTRSRSSGDEDSYRGQSTDVQSGSLPPARTGDQVHAR